VARLRAQTLRDFCSRLPRLLCSVHAVAYVCSMHAEAYVCSKYAETFAQGRESLVLESCQVCSRHDETFVFFSS
jgi:hypothetical protein